MSSDAVYTYIFAIVFGVIYFFVVTDKYDKEISELKSTINSQGEIILTLEDEKSQLQMSMDNANSCLDEATTILSDMYLYDELEEVNEHIEEAKQELVY